MARLIESLPAGKKEQTLKIIENLLALKENALELQAKFSIGREQLASVSSREEFDTVVRKIVSYEKEANQLLMKAINGTLDDDNYPALLEIISEDVDLNLIWQTLHFNEDNLKLIEATNMRLLTQDLLTRFSGEKKAAVVSFLEGLESLKPIATALLAQKKVFEEELKKCASIEDVGVIETEVSHHHDVAKTVLQSQLPFPIDKDVKAATMDYIDKNTKAFDTIKSFDLNEALADQLMSAKMRCSKALKPTG